RPRPDHLCRHDLGRSTAAVAASARRRAAVRPGTVAEPRSECRNPRNWTNRWAGRESANGCRGQQPGAPVKRTSAVALILLALVGGGAGYLLDHLLTVSGRATFAPSGFLPILLLLIAAAVLA